MRFRTPVECGTGGVQGRDSRSHASLQPATAPTWRLATLHQRRISMALRNLGVLRTFRALDGLISQETARTNACEASDELRRRRHEREEVDAYLEALHSHIAADTG